MHVWRRWIFPLLMIVVFAAIAAALVKIAFFPDQAEAVVEPSAQLTEASVPVERGSLVNELTLAGTVARDATVPIRSEIDGTVTAVHVAPGATVVAGQALFTIKQGYPVKNIDVLAPEAGTITEFAVVRGQSASIGGDLATLSPARFHVLSTIAPVQLYRLLDAPDSADVTIAGGPAPFTCTGLTVQVAEDGTTSVRCAVPADQVVFPGLQATVDIRIGTVEDALIIPTTAVLGGAESGRVWIAGDDGDLEERAIVLGINDGTSVAVLEGLAEGELIRQFVPGVAAPTEQVCYDDGMGGEFCEEAGWNW